MEQTPQAFFQTTFEPIGRARAARHARGGSGLQRKWRTRTYRTRPTYGLQLSIFPASPLIPTVTPSSLPWERVRERATSRKACIGAVRVLGKVAAIRRMPSPQPSPTGEGAGCSEFKRCRSSEKECPEHQQQEFSGSLYRKVDGTNAANVFSDDL